MTCPLNAGKDIAMPAATADPVAGFPALFSPFRVAGCCLKNRIVALPVYTGYAHPDGSVGDLMVRHYGELARSGAALVVVANGAVTADGMISDHNLRIDRDDLIPGLTRLAAAIHRHGALACLQLNHAGRFARTARPLLPAPLDTTDLAFNLASLKDFMHFFPFEKRFGLTHDFLNMINGWTQAMSEADRDRVLSGFAEAARRAVTAGFDMIELHGAGGYLISQFLSPFTNRNPYRWGGDLERRSRFPLAVVRSVAEQVPEGYPIGFRLMLREWVPGGIDLPEALSAARLLQAAGIAYLSPSVGSYNSMFTPAAARQMTKAAYMKPDVARLTRTVDIPTVIAGRVITPALADRLIREGTADLVGLGRPLRADSAWIQKAARGRRKIRTCVNCNHCLKRVVLDRGFSCTRWPGWQQEKTDLDCRLLDRGRDGLLVAEAAADLEYYRALLPFLYPATSDPEKAFSLDLLILETADRLDSDSPSVAQFADWFRQAYPVSRFSCRFLKPEPGADIDPIDRILHREIQQSGAGMVLLRRGQASGRKWRERLLYRSRRKVVGLIGSTALAGGILVPVDLSSSTLLVAAFLKRTFLVGKTEAIQFVHVPAGPPAGVMQRWRDIARIADLDPPPELMLAPPSDRVAEGLVEVMQNGDFGTLVMGKRGISGIKRRLLGSVSAGVLKRLSDRTLFLVD